MSYWYEGLCGVQKFYLCNLKNNCWFEIGKEIAASKLSGAKTSFEVFKIYFLSIYSVYWCALVAVWFIVSKTYSC